MGYWEIRLLISKLYFIGLRFSEKCCLYFAVLIVFAGVFLVIGLKPVAEALANVAYIMLVIAVVGRIRQ